MVCTAIDLLEWKDFPKGLRVLLLAEDTNSAIEIKSKLEEMEYIVSAFSSVDEALSAVSSKHMTFHVAIVEVSIHDNNGRFKFLETVKDLPTIMTSKEHCLSTMMNCIALGAVEFLIKPLSEDKLRNIWQHVVHKAFSASGNVTSESLKSIKEFVGSMLEIQPKNVALQNDVSEDLENDSKMNENQEQSAIIDKCPAPSTPQPKRGELADDGDCQYETSSSPVKENGELGTETKSVDSTYGDSVFEMEMDLLQPAANVAIKEEQLINGSKGTNDFSNKPHDSNSEDVPNLGDNTENSNKLSSTQNVCGAKGQRKKFKVDWTPELHKKFVKAVEKLGLEHAIPSRILELMKVEGLTRHNIASHLQKYRMHRRHILPKENHRRFPGDTVQRNYYPHNRPVIAFPPYGTNHALTTRQVYPAWGQHGVQPPHLMVWGPPSYPWQPAESWHWKPYPGMHADAWGCPVFPPPSYPPLTFPRVQGSYEFHSSDQLNKNYTDLYMGEEVIDKVIQEVISKPGLPLPIGLKPPSTDIVVTELSRQGISTVPPHINDH